MFHFPQLGLFVLLASSAVLADKHPAPAYGHPAPAPYHPPAPKLHVPERNCTVNFEKSKAEMCVPTVQTQCTTEDVTISMPKEEEKCITVTTTSCKADVTTREVETCVYEYEKKDIEADAKTVDVKYTKRCDTEYASVCKQVKAKYGYGKPEEVCKEVPQEVCYNTPVVSATSLN